MYDEGGKMIKPIETVYKGYRFRSRLEARWGVFFDALNIPWEYEKEGFDINGKYYLPDFWLPTLGLRNNISDLGLWIEIKNPEADRNNNEDDIKYQGVVKYTNRPLILYHGVPGYNDFHYEGGYEYSLHNIDDEDVVTWDNYMIFCHCYNDQCNHIKIEFSEGNYMYCPKCKASSDNEHEKIILAIERAKGARFEHGEKG